ncbi:MAG: DUF554 domain-containing protein [Clostridia bacterium]|nr:DUF554 domain-containing protein [Clostridia bacterium]
MGTIINVIGILAAGLFGWFFGKYINESVKKSLTVTCGIGVIFVSVSGAMEGMLKLKDGKLVSFNGMMLVICLIIGTVIGEILDIDGAFQKFGEWLKLKSKNENDKSFVDAFITASFTVCIGAMAIVGSIKDGISGDFTILLTKTILDFIIIAVMTSSLGKGAVFSAIPVAILQGSVTILGMLIKQNISPSIIFNISLIGSALIFTVGLNLVFDKKIKVANMLPALIPAVIFGLL